MRIGFVGLGKIGQPMAKHILNGGHDMQVFDLRREACTPLLNAGAILTNSPREAANGAEIIFTSLPGPTEVLAAALGETGLLGGMDSGSIFADLSTVSPESIQQIGETARASGIEVLDCPVSGGVQGALDAELCVMVGGEKKTVDRIRPILELIGDPDRLIHCGPLGSGSVCKIANNLIGMTTSVVLSEAFSMGVRAGIDAQILYDVISRSTGDSYTLRTLPTSVFTRNFEPGFRLALGAKDVRLAIDLGRSLGVPMEISNLVDQYFTEAIQLGLGPLSSTAITKLQEDRAEVKIRTNKAILPE